MLKLNYRYNQNSVRLNVEGLPDKSLDQSAETIGILSSWQLELVGMPSLEGKRSHLEALMAAVLPYARYYLSGVQKKFGDISSPVTISPNGTAHKIVLRSSQEGVNPLELLLDDAELADLIRCFDYLIEDERVLIPWDIPEYKPMKYSEKIKKVPLTQKLSTSILAISSLLVISLLYLYIPEPDYRKVITNNSNPSLNNSNKD